jgi:hypothetical protein
MVQYINKENGVGSFMEDIDVSVSDVNTSGICIGFYVTVGGDVTFVSDGSTITLTSGDLSYHPIRVTQFKNVGTDATGIKALYV